MLFVFMCLRVGQLLGHSCHANMTVIVIKIGINIANTVLYRFYDRLIFPYENAYSQ
jgi:hypothetical protein